jgi:hemoglobin
VIVEYLRYAVGDPEEFERAYARAAEVLAQAPECVDYELARRTDADAGPGADPDPVGTTRYVLRIRWTSAQDHLQGFRRSPAFGSFFAAIRPYVGAIAEMRHYEVTEIVGTGGVDREGSGSSVG